jgi:hypothetical protein
MYPLSNKVGQIMSQSFAPTVAHENQLVLRALADCASLADTPGVSVASSVCGALWPRCVDRLKANCKAMGVAPPASVSPALQLGPGSVVVEEEEEELEPQKKKEAKANKKRKLPAGGSKGKGGGKGSGVKATAKAKKKKVQATTAEL